MAVFLDDELYYVRVQPQRHRSARSSGSQRVITPQPLRRAARPVPAQRPARRPPAALQAVRLPQPVPSQQPAAGGHCTRRWACAADAQARDALWLYAPGASIPMPRPTSRWRPARIHDRPHRLRFGQGGSYVVAVHAHHRFQSPHHPRPAQDLFWGTTDPIAPHLSHRRPEAVTLGEVVYGLGDASRGSG